MNLIKFTLAGNDRQVYINADSVTAIFTDNYGSDKEGTRICTADRDYTIVKENLDSVLYSLDEAVNPDWYEEAVEESGPLTSEAAKHLLQNATEIKKMCESKDDCPGCVFYDYSKGCLFGVYPCKWKIRG